MNKLYFTTEDIMRTKIPNWENMSSEEQQKAKEAFFKANAEADRKEKEAEELARKNTIRDTYLLFPKYRICRFENSDNGNSAFMEIAKKYVDTLPKMLEQKTRICFTGNVGVGKTHMLACMANEIIDKYNKAPLMSTLSELISRLLDERDNNWTWNYAKTCAILFLDDFGIERQSEFILEKTFELLDARTQLDKAVTIISTNIDKNELLKSQSELRMARIYSRFNQLCRKIFTVKGYDRRYVPSKESQEAINNLTGGF